MPVLTLAEAQGLAAAALVRNRTDPDNAAIVARALVAAEADGQKGHGLSRVASYAAQSLKGKVDGFAHPTLVRPKTSVLLVDAAHGFAYPALDLAAAMIPQIVGAAGLACASITRSHHCGAAGLVVEQLAERGMVALLFANTPSAIAPWGGSVGVFGTNPIAFACPLPDQPPLVIDLSLSKVARGNLVAAKQRGERIPEGWAVDKDGKPTTDPDAGLAGTMVPMGDAKGTALALMVELLAAGLTGSNFAAEASSFLDDKGSAPGTGQFILAIDLASFGGAAAVARFGRLAASIEAQPGARLPGRRRLALRAKARENGLDVADKLIAEIKAL
jgi:(2R)-3-sulfolactate dehydrogenase (NADP+)